MLKLGFVTLAGKLLSDEGTETLFFENVDEAASCRLVQSGCVIIKVVPLELHESCMEFFEWLSKMEDFLNDSASLDQILLACYESGQKSVKM